MKILGIDPGLTGAWALLETDGSLIAADDLPVRRDGSTAWIDGCAFRRMVHLHLSLEMASSLRVAAYVERVHAMPKNGAVGGFSQGMTFGSILCALGMMDAVVHLVAPISWRGFAQVRLPATATDPQRKRRSLEVAAQHYPFARLGRVKDHNLAEALLIARYGAHVERQGVAA